MNETPSHPMYPIDRRGERILAAALAEFGRTGFAAARMPDIARRAGISAATLALYFSTKEELFREVVRSTVLTTIQAASQAAHPIAPETDALTRLREFARRFWRAMESPEQEALLRLSIGELPGFPELALLHTTEIIGRALAELEQILSDGIASRELRIREPRTAARIVLSAVMLYALWLAAPALYGGITGPDRDRAEAAVLDVLADTLQQEPA